MNAHLRKVKDGAMRRFDVYTTSHATRQESGEIYWPFALAWPDRDAWAIV